MSLTFIAQVDTAWFSENVCGAAIGHTYTYQNYTSGSGGSGTVYGYNIYRDGNIVYSDYGTPAGGNPTYCEGILFINDSIGYHIKGNAPGTGVKKTNDYGQTWVQIGGGPPGYLNMYPVNEHYVYAVMYYGSSIWISKSTDMPGESTMLYYGSPQAYVPITDTIIGDPLCNNDSLIVYFSNGTDTFSFPITIVSRQVGLKGNKQDEQKKLSLFPNPAQTTFSISGLDNVPEKISVINSMGMVLKTYDKEEARANKYEVEGFPAGMYFIKIDFETGTSTQKLFLSK